MGCTEIDVRDYFFGELPEAEGHIAACADCTAALGQLRATRTALLTLREEEPPQRIGFVSDKIFQPSPLRRFFASFWLSGARLGFASAAMLSIALIVSARMAPVQQVDVNAAVARAVKTAMAGQEQKTRQLLEAADAKHRLQEQELEIRVSEYTNMLDKRMAANQYMAMDTVSLRTQ
jgi:anti-sigma factor RsiW